MRRPDIELTDEAASYVEQHPGVIEKLAAGIPDERPAALSTTQKARLRSRLHETRAYAASDEGQATATAMLARVGLGR